MNKEDKTIIDNWDGEIDEGHLITATIKPEFEEVVKQSPDVEKDDFITPENEDEVIDELGLRCSCPWFWCEVERESLEEWVAQELKLKIEWIDNVSVDG